MYVTDLTHYLDSKGAIAPERGPARKMADFLTAVVAHASDFDRPYDAPGPFCFKCRQRDRRAVNTALPRTMSCSGAAPPAAPRGRSRTGRTRSGI